eukprot:1192305-Prorocentrum_minimum.AAC.3
MRSTPVTPLGFCTSDVQRLQEATTLSLSRTKKIPAYDGYVLLPNRVVLKHVILMFVPAFRRTQITFGAPFARHGVNCASRGASVRIKGVGQGERHDLACGAF